MAEYAANERHIACLHSSLSRYGSNIQSLAHELREFPDSVTVTDGGLQLENHQGPISLDEVSLDGIVESLEKLATANDEKARMESSLQRAGLENVIKFTPLKMRRRLSS